MGEPGCDVGFSGLVWAVNEPNQSYEDHWGDVENSGFVSQSMMSFNLVLDDLDEGWHSVGIKAMSNSPNLGKTDFNVQVYSSESPVHIYDGDALASTQRMGEYVEPNAPALPEVVDDGYDGYEGYDDGWWTGDWESESESE